ncbi:transposase [Formosa sp. PL04]|uniref:transposase n=1 Tax=Formosa sp. PL04 TaxID=3081755 RepID=UPI0029858782|nr:transposase [Formosa sp. PL04]
MTIAFEGRFFRSKRHCPTSKSIMGPFHRFKLHIVTRNTREILNFIIARVNIDDKTPLQKKNFLGKVHKELYADKAYVGKI